MLACYTDETIEVRALNVTMPSNVPIVLTTDTAAPLTTFFDSLSFNT